MCINCESTVLYLKTARACNTSCVTSFSSLPRAFMILSSDPSSNPDWTRSQSLDRVKQYLTLVNGGSEPDPSLSPKKLYFLAVAHMTNDSARSPDALPPAALSYTNLPTSLRLNQTYVEVSFRPSQCA